MNQQGALIGRRAEHRRLRVVFRIAAFLTMLLVAGAIVHAQPAAVKIAPILEEMRCRGGDFAAEPLHAMGTEGLSALLDWFLPQSAKPLSADAIDPAALPWVKQLANDNFAKREVASKKLAQMGVLAYPAVLTATRDNDAEVSFRARQILRGWKTQRIRDMPQYLAAFRVYVAAIDDQARIAAMTVHVKSFLASSSTPPSGFEAEIVRQCISGVTRTGKDRAIDPLASLVTPGNLPVAGFVLGAVAQGATPDYCPALLLETLRSDRADLLQAVLGCWPDCRKTAQAGEIQQRLRTIMEGPQEDLRPLACRVLYRQFDHPAATDYLVRELEAPGNAGRRMPAILCLLEPRTPAKTLPPPLLKALGKLTQSKDVSDRFQAAQTLANYRGEEVVKLLVPLLGDVGGDVAAQRGLRNQTDWEMVRKVLDDAANHHPDTKVRTRARRYLKDLDAGLLPSGH